MNEFAPAETLHRLVKQAIDSGMASSIDDANTIFFDYRLAFSIGEAEVRDPAHQAALLTGIALARRVFLGGVSVAGALDVPLAVPLPLGETLRTAVETLGAQCTTDETGDGPRIFISGTRAHVLRDFASGRYMQDGAAESFPHILIFWAAKSTSCLWHRCLRLLSQSAKPSFMYRAR